MGSNEGMLREISEAVRAARALMGNLLPFRRPAAVTVRDKPSFCFTVQLDREPAKEKRT